MCRQKIDIKFYSEYYNVSVYWAKIATLIYVPKKKSRNFEELCKKQNVKLSDIPGDFDWRAYLYLNNDLIQAGYNSYYKAALHYLMHGKKENRVFASAKTSKNFEHLFESKRDPINIVELSITPELANNFLGSLKSRDLKNKIRAIKKELRRKSLYKKPVVSESDFYLNLGGNLRANGDNKLAEKSYKISLKINNKNARAKEHFANLLLDKGQIKSALLLYKDLSIIQENSFWVKYNLGVCHENLKEFQKAFAIYREAVSLFPEKYLAVLALNRVIQKLWEEKIASARECLEKSRSEAILIYDEAFEFCKQQFSELYPKTFKQKYSVIENVLIIADKNIPQCARYRVEQKKEQLKELLIKVEVISWDDEENFWDKISLNDVVIFYRVPATPKIIEAFYLSRSIGKKVIYEIDDLIFDEKNYPAPLETFGGLVDEGLYLDLQHGSTLFRQALSLFSHGIASTEPLRKKMLDYMRPSSQVFVHRNGLDEAILKSSAHQMQKFNKGNSIYIFYGTGTKAHNDDFDKYIMPSLLNLLPKHENLKLLVVGYLSLSEELNKFSEKIIHIPLVSDLDAYFYLLKNADINIAPLEPSIINNAKSELKWVEAGVFSIPSVVSGTENYYDVVEDGVDCLVANTSSEWEKCLEELICDSELRKSIGSSAKNRIMLQYGVERLAENFVKEVLSESRAGKRKKKKVLVVNVFFAPQSIGGATRVVEDNVKILSEKYSSHYEIVVLTTNELISDKNRFEQYRVDGIKVTRLNLSYKENFEWNYENIELKELYEKFLDYEQPDFVHFHCIQRLTGTIVDVVKKREIPYIVTAHDAWWISDYQFLVNEKDEYIGDKLSNIDEFPAKLEFGLSFKRKMYLAGLLKSAKLVLPVSASFEKVYNSAGIKNTRCIENGINPKRLGSPVNNTVDGTKVILALVGGMSAHKGYYLLREAITSGQYDNIKILIVDHSREHGESCFGKWGNTDVEFVGRYPQGKISELYAKFHVLVAPSIWPESFGLVTREALYFGKWVIASNLGAIGDCVKPGKNGFIVDVRDSNDLGNCINEINKNSKKYSQPCAWRGEVKLVDLQVAELHSLYSEYMFN